MSFEEVQFPTDISYGSQGGPQFSTTISVQAAGHEKRNIDWAQARYTYDVAYGVKDQSLMETLITFFQAMAGRGYGFRYKDHLDYKSTASMATAIGDTDQVCKNTVTGGYVGDGSTTTFQIMKTYSGGAQTRRREITKPVSGTVVVSLDDVSQNASPLGWSVDTTTGIITFTTPPGSNVVVKAGYEFDVPVRFDTDEISARWVDYELLTTSVPLVEVRI